MVSLAGAEGKGRWKVKKESERDEKSDCSIVVRIVDTG